MPNSIDKDYQPRDERVEVEQMKVELSRLLMHQEAVMVDWFRTMGPKKRAWLLAMAEEDMAALEAAKPRLRLVISA